MYTVPQLIRSPGWEPDGILKNLLGMIIYKQLCSKIMYFLVIFLNCAKKSAGLSSSSRRRRRGEEMEGPGRERAEKFMVCFGFAC